MRKKTYEEFLEKVKEDCKKYAISLEFRRGKSVNLGGFRCGGYFDEEERKLVVAKGHKNFKELLVHEYSHMTQWLEGIDIWNKASESLRLMQMWLDGNDIPDIRKHISICRDLELDNEKRAANFIRKYDLGIDPREYIRKANAYVLFYNWIMETRKWSKPKNSPYTNKKIISLMSSKFNMNYKSLDVEIREIFEKEGI